MAFYTAKNKSDRPITGVATYNVYPPKAGIYFNKIQCFCFEEQRLGAGEEIDMPVSIKATDQDTNSSTYCFCLCFAAQVFFFLDPEMLDDPAMDSVNTVTLSYTFFKTGEEDPAADEEDHKKQ